MKNLLFFLNTKNFSLHHRREEILEYSRQAAKSGLKTTVCLQPRFILSSKPKPELEHQSDTDVLPLWCLIPLSLGEKLGLLMWLFVKVPIYWQLRRFKTDKTITWIFRPEQAYVPEKALKIFLIYDHYVADAKRKLRDKTKKLLFERINESDLVLVCSKKLMVELQSVASRPFIYYPNAISKVLIESAKKTSNPSNTACSTDSNKSETLTVGFVGNMDQSFDIDLVEYLVKSSAGRKFVFVGPCPDRVYKRLIKYDNVSLKGRVDYAQLSYYISSFDLCICPYKQDQFSNYRNPLKVFEYLAHNKPVISTDCDLPEDISKHVFITNDSTEFSSLLNNNAICNKPFTFKQFIGFHEENSWNARVRTVLRELQKLGSV